MTILLASHVTGSISQKAEMLGSGVAPPVKKQYAQKKNGNSNFGENMYALYHKILRAGFWQNRFLFFFVSCRIIFVDLVCCPDFSPHLCIKKCPEQPFMKTQQLFQQLYNKNQIPTHFLQTGRCIRSFKNPV